MFLVGKFFVSLVSAVYFIDGNVEGIEAVEEQRQLIVEKTRSAHFPDSMFPVGRHIVADAPFVEDDFLFLQPFVRTDYGVGIYFNQSGILPYGRNSFAGRKLIA